MNDKHDERRIKNIRNLQIAPDELRSPTNPRIVRAALGKASRRMIDDVLRLRWSHTVPGDVVHVPFDPLKDVRLISIYQLALPN